MAAVLVHEQTWSKYVDVYTIGYGTELPEAEADVDPDEVADAVDDPDAELEDDEHAEDEVALAKVILQTRKALRRTSIASFFAGSLKGCQGIGFVSSRAQIPNI